MPKYSCYEYEIENWFITNDPDEKPKYVYTIFLDDFTEQSDEWYHTEQEAEDEAKSRIDVLEDGPEYEGNYEERMAMKPRDIDWDERRKMGE